MNDAVRDLIEELNRPSAARLNAFIRSVATAQQWEAPRDRRWSFHGLRHGRVGDLLRLGYSRDVIKDAGRWASEGAFRVYLN